MIVAIHQPSYLPWIPFLEKGIRSDIYLFHDNVQFDKNSEQNRNRVKTPQGQMWLSVPVTRHTETLICDVQIAESEKNWARKHRRVIEENYRKAPNFDEVAGRLFPIFDHPWTKLVDLNLAIDHLFLQWAGFTGKTIRVSELEGIEGIGSQRVLKVCQAVGAKTYLSGIGALDYMNIPEFEQAGIKVLFQQYRHSEYPQQYPKAGFVPHLSALDFFMNVGVSAIAKEFIVAHSHWVTKAELQEEEARKETHETP